MKIVNPFAVTAAAYTASNIVEPDGTEAAYAGGTTYAAAARAIDTKIVYVSLQAGNTGHQPSTSPLWWSPIGPQLWKVGTTYAQNDVVSWTNHRTYVSAVGSNVGNQPDLAASATKWTDTGPTDKWALFDNFTTTQATYIQNIDVTVQTTGRINTLAVLNVSAATVRVICSTPSAGVVYDKTTSMEDYAGITDLYAYFSLPVTRFSDLILVDLPLYTNMAIEVILTDSAGVTVKCGNLIFGLFREIGDTQYGAQVGIQDYSTKSADAFGNFTIVQRAFAKRGTFQVMIDPSMTDRLSTMLAGYRATPILYIGSDSFTSTAVFGFYKDFSVEIPYFEKSMCSIEIEGLT